MQGIDVRLSARLNNCLEIKKMEDAIVDEVRRIRSGNIEKILAEESQTIKQLDALYTRAGACLHGARIKEGLSQMALAEKIGISQTNLSKMEVGKRPIGKVMAKRIAAILKVNYRIFL